MEKEIINKYKIEVAEKKQDVTIFMLTHNREQYVALAIKSVLEQTYKNFQLIVLDNCSTDGTAEVINAFEDERVNYLYRKSTDEMPNSIFAFKNCATEFIIILHDDDILENTYLEKVVKAIKENSRIVAVSVSGTLINECGDKIGCYNVNYDKLFCDNDYLKYYFSEAFVSVIYPSVIYRTSYFNRYDIFGYAKNAGPAGDQVLWFQTERYGGQILILSDILIKYRQHSGQDSYKNYGLMDLQLLDFLYQDKYYYSQLISMKNRINKKIFHSFKAVLLNYSFGIIQRERFVDIINYKCVKKMKRNILGLCLYIIIKICVRNDNIIKKVVKKYKGKNYE